MNRLIGFPIRNYRKNILPLQSHVRYTNCVLNAGFRFDRLLRNDLFRGYTTKTDLDNSLGKKTVKLRKKAKRHDVTPLNRSVEVIDVNSKQKQIKVQTIYKSKTLSRLLNQTNSTSIKKNVILTVPNDCSKNFFQPKILENIVNSYHEFIVKTLKSGASSKKSEKIQLQEKEEHKKKMEKLETLKLNLQSYLDACVATEMISRGMATLRSYRKRNNESQAKIDLRDVNLYRILMNKFAANGDINRIGEICSMIDADRIQYTPPLYATIFECIGRMEDEKKQLSELKKYLSKAAKDNVTFNDIMDKSQFVRDQRFVTLKALRLANPEFVPKYKPPPLNYTNPMVEHLNADIDPIDVRIESLRAKNQVHKISNAKQGFSVAELNQITKEQLQNEEKGMLEVKNISLNAETITPEVIQARQQFNKLMTDFQCLLCDRIKRSISTAQHVMINTIGDRIDVYPYLKLLPIEKYAEILIERLKHLAEGSEMYTPTVTQIYREIGEKVYEQHVIHQRQLNGITDKTKHVYEIYSELLSSGAINDNPRQLWQRISYQMKENGPDLDIKNVKWSRPVYGEIGRFLFKIMLQELKIIPDSPKKNETGPVPLLYTVFRNRELKSREEIRVHPALVSLCIKSRPETLSFSSNLVPMMCPPVPWTSTECGGYFIRQSDLLRLPFEVGHQIQLVKDRPISEVYPALDALNQLGAIAWRINTRVLDIVMQIFNTGGSDKFNVPKTPKNVMKKNHTEIKYYERSETYAFNTANKSTKHQEEAAAYSLWCDTLYKLSLANHFRDRVFWLPHNMDFRGRVYPVPPHLNHLSSDVSRSLLVFNRKQPLGKDGLRWLKLHCINLTGLKKRDSITTRLEYAEEIIDDIIDSADNPVNGRQWWLQSDEPWQTLACCIEIADAMRSPDPEQFMSSLPIHQDGSCNGLQHYAALGRDKVGAYSVNLSPSETPQDVYSAVAALVEKARESDAANGLPIAVMLDGVIKRKLIKQTVMTTVYGVTMYGAQLQIQKQLKALDTFPKDQSKRAACYLAQKTFASLGQMFTSAQEIQDWFTNCARFISQQHHKHVEWITPLGLPVIQPYIRANTKFIKLKNFEQSTVSDRFGKVNCMKEKNAFPPNFVHSLDSCHMMLTSLNCERAGITFVSVHDCFWTHANSVEIMSKICREQFVLLHSQPIIENLSDYFVERYEIESKENLPDDHIFKKFPKKGEFDLNNVLKSVYFFS